MYSQVLPHLPAHEVLVLHVGTYLLHGRLVLVLLQLTITYLINACTHSVPQRGLRTPDHGCVTRSRYEYRTAVRVLFNFICAETVGNVEHANTAVLVLGEREG